MKVIVIDNYDSFTYNLVHIIENITGIPPDVFRNDEVELSAIATYDLIVLSPGPGIPNEAGLLKEIIKKYAPIKPIFGVCLGLQAIVEVFGGEIENLDKVFHGVATKIELIDDNTFVFKNIPQFFDAGRYHSWVASRNSIPDDLVVTAIDENNQIMGLQHKKYNVSAVQFHPESVLTPLGAKMIENVIEQAANYASDNLSN